MIKKFFSLAFVALTLQGLSQTLDNYQKAFSILEKARVAMGSQVHDNILVIKPPRFRKPWRFEKRSFLKRR